jgi:hypothetical protein
MFRTLKYFLTLRPYGHHLCGPEVSFWLVFANLALVLICVAEGAAWGYVGYFLGVAEYRYLSAAVLAAVAALAVWTVDATFLSQDLHRAGFDRQLRGLTVNADTSVTWHQTVKARLKLAGGFAIRLAMVAGSLTVAAPYVSQLFFYREVSTVLADRDAGILRSARERINARFDEQVKPLERRQETLGQQIIDEAAGKGPSHLVGRGPTVRTMEDQVAALGRQIAALQTARAAELTQFDRDPGSELFRRYGVNLGADGIHARNEAMETIRSQPGFTQTEWTVRAVLLGLFLVMIVVKWYEPLGAQIYYSAVCQDSFRAYLAGHFKGLLMGDDLEPAHDAMTPLLFFKWLCNNVAAHERKTQLKTQLQGIRSHQSLKESSIKEVRVDSEEPMEKIFADLERAQLEASRAAETFLKAEAEHKTVLQHVAQHRAAIDAIDNAMAYPRVVNMPNHFVTALDTRTTWIDGLADLETQERAAKLQLERAQTDLAAKNHEMDSITREVEKQRTVVVVAEQAVTDLRLQALEAIKNVSA